MNIRTLYGLLGGGGGGSWGALGFYGGPVVGVITTTAGAATGAIVGYFVGPCCESGVKTAEKVPVITQKAIEAMDKATKTINSAQELAEEAKGLAENVSRFVEGATNLTNPNVNGVANINGAVENGRSAVGAATNGAAILAIGLSVGFGLWMMGLDCNPACTNQNAELIRLAAMAIATTGVAVLGFSGIRSIFQN